MFRFALLSIALTVPLRIQAQSAAGHGSAAPGPRVPYSAPHRQAASAPRESFAGAAASGITYTCGPHLQAAAPEACGTLNSTIASLYGAAFANAGASIYIDLGNTQLGESLWRYDAFDYSTFRNALIAAANDSNDFTALAASAPPSNPFPGGFIGIQPPLERVLGLPASASTGVKSNGFTACSLPASGCYDGVIIISNSEPLYYRTSSIAPNQYDFYTVAEHETDEILGSSSCAIGCGSGIVFPVDLFRYHSNGKRSFGAGSNASCAAPAAGNACLSLDGVRMLQQYNNVNNGDDPGDWVTDCAAPLVQDAEICPGLTGIDISPAAEILVLDVIGYTAQAGSVNPSSIQGIVGGGLSVPPVTSISANGYFSIFGQNLATLPVDLTSSDLVNGSLPTNLGSTCVNVGAAHAFPTYVSASQINAIAPEISAPGSEPVTVTVHCGTGLALTLPAIDVPVASAAPEFLYWVQYSNGQDPVVAVDAVHGDYIGSPGLIAGLTFRPARGGDVLTLYGISFGHTVSGGPVPGNLPSVPDSVPSGYSVRIGSVTAAVSYVGVSPGTAGLYQVNLTIPSGLTPGNYPIVLNVNGASTPSGAFLTIGS